MKAFLSSLLIAFSVFTTGSCLECWMCEKYNGNTCDVLAQETCGAHISKCITTLTLQKNGTQEIYNTKKSCAYHPKMCLATYSMSNGIEMNSKAECCNGDFCNLPPLTMDRKDEKENGVECPVCVSNGLCCAPKIGAMKKCTGSETKCYTFHGGVYNGTNFVEFSHQGCCTENLCQDILKTYPDSLFKSGFLLYCPKPRHSAPSPSYLLLPVHDL